MSNTQIFRSHFRNRPAPLLIGGFLWILWLIPSIINMSSAIMLAVFTLLLGSLFLYFSSFKVIFSDNDLTFKSPLKRKRSFPYKYIYIIKASSGLATRPEETSRRSHLMAISQDGTFMTIAVKSYAKSDLESIARLFVEKCGEAKLDKVLKLWAHQQSVGASTRMSNSSFFLATLISFTAITAVFTYPASHMMTTKPEFFSRFNEDLRNLLAFIGNLVGVPSL